MKKTAIEFVDTCKRFGNMDGLAVDHVNLTINDGEIVTIVGRSGSGKTTLMKMVNLLYDITSGDILFFGNSIKSINPIYHRRNIGYVVQQSGLFPHMNVRNNIALIPNILQWDPARIEKRVDELLTLVDLAPQIYKKRFPRQLSGGQQQRVGIARALASNPNVMLMDEPFGAIDTITREALQNELLRIQKLTKKTILFVTHDMKEAIKLGDRILVMDNGAVQQFDTPNEIIMHPANEFVSKLITADNDKSARLQLLTIDVIMQELSGEVSIGKNDIVMDSTSNVQQVFPYYLANSGANIYVKEGENIIGVVSKAKFDKLVNEL